MSKKTYSEKLRDPRWQKKRLEVLNKDNFTCVVCGDAETELHVHHQEYNGNPWDADLSVLFTVCKHCHLELEIIGKSVHISAVSIYKSTGWGNGSRIMIISFEENCTMAIYDKADNQIAGFVLDINTMSQMVRAFEIPLSKPLRLKSLEPVEDLPF